VSKSDLSRFPIFAGLLPLQLQKIESILQKRRYKVGEDITCEGEYGDELFLLLQGKVEVSKLLTLMVGRGDIDTRDKSLVQLRAEDAPYFGEMALLRENAIRSATVKALEESVVGIIKHKDLVALSESDIELGYRLMKNIAQMLAERLEKTNQDILKLTTAFSLALQS
jgi:CRP/FNR family cyclic AMP-dependent transcriptional regulator